MVARMQQQAWDATHPVLILGCGYIGIAVAREILQQGGKVVAVKRTAHTQSDKVLAHPNLTWIHADLAEAQCLEKHLDHCSHVLYAASSGYGGIEAYKRSYVEGLTQVIPQIQALGCGGRFVYLSSTGVYGQNEGQWVDEKMATRPDSETARVLVEAEKILLQACRQDHFPGIILRLSGIYGPGRSYAMDRVLQGEVQLVSPGIRWVNMIHREDVVQAILASMQSGAQGAIYNVSDDEPVPMKHLYGWLAEQLKRPQPVMIDPSHAAATKRQVTHKRILNQKIKTELGLSWHYPDFKAGYTPLLKPFLEGTI